MRSKKYEFWGLILGFLGGGWQLLVERTLSDIDIGQQQYRLNEKIDAIWMAQLDMYTHQYPDRTDILSSANVKSLQDKFTLINKSEPLNEQIEWSRIVSGIIFTIGGLLFICGKWIEVGETAGANKQ